MKTSIFVIYSPNIVNISNLSKSFASLTQESGSEYVKQLLLLFQFLRK